MTLPPGLSWRREVLDLQEHREALALAVRLLDEHGKKFVTRSKVARYGLDYSLEPVPVPMRETIPPELAALAVKIGLPSTNSVTINLYEFKDRIDQHTDLPCFDPVGVLNLQASALLIFLGPASSDRVLIPLSMGDLVVMRGEVIKTWTHGVPFVVHPRISIVFRTHTKAINPEVK